MQSGKDFRVRKTKITRYIFKYITRFWTLKSTSILGGSFTSALFPQTVWCSHGWTFAPLRATPTVHWTTYFGWRNVKTCRYRRFWPMRSCDWWWGAPRKDPTPNCKYLRRELQALISPHEIPRLFRVRPDSCAFYQQDSITFMHHEPSFQLVIQLQAFPKCTIDVDRGLKTWRYPQQLVTQCCCGLWWIFRKHREGRWGGLESRWRTLDYVQVGFMLEKFCADCRFIKYVQPPGIKLNTRAWQAPRIHSRLVMTLSSLQSHTLMLSVGLARNLIQAVWTCRNLSPWKSTLGFRVH